MNNLLKKYGLTEKDVFVYVMSHRDEDFSMDKTLDDFFKEIKQWNENHD